MTVAKQSRALGSPAHPSGGVDRVLGLGVAALFLVVCGVLAFMSLAPLFSRDGSQQAEGPWAIGKPATVVDAWAGVRVYEQPSSTSRTLGALKTGEPLTIRSAPVQAWGATWVLVSWDRGNLTGWMRQQSLEPGR